MVLRRCNTCRRQFDSEEWLRAFVVHPNLILEQAGGMEITGNEEDPSLISDRTEMAISMLLDVRSDLCQHRVRGFHVYTYNCVCVCVR